MRTHCSGVFQSELPDCCDAGGGVCEESRVKHRRTFASSEEVF